VAGGEEAVVRVLGVQVVVGPVAVEAALGGPERVEEVEAALVDLVRQPALQRGEGVEGGRGREQVGQGSAGHGEEAALGVGLREDPVAEGGIHGEAEVTDEDDGAGGGVEGAGLGAGDVAPGAVGGFEPLEGLDEAQEAGRRAAEVLVGAERDEGTVGGAVGGGEVALVAAVGAAELLDAPQEGAVESGR
jgi:hypothetical protein